MSEEIKVHVAEYGHGRNLMMRYRDPITGRHVARSAGTRVLREAERAAAKWEAELREGRYKAPCRMTWADFRERYETEVIPGLAESTGDRRASTLNYLERTINPQRVAELTTARLSEFISKLREGGMKETTLGCHLAHLKPVLRWAVKQGYLRTMPDVPMPKRAKGITRAMRGRAITLEEFERLLLKVPKVRKRQPKRWRRLLRGLWLSGLRLSEALCLSWDPNAPISVSLDGKYPALRICAEAEKAHRDRLLPIAPEFAEFLLAVPSERRHGLVFGIYGPNRQPLSTRRVGRYIGRIGKAAKVVTNKAENRYATAHDLRRSFGSRWAKRVMPAVLKDLMRHADISTTMAYYVDQSAEDVGDVLRQAMCNTQCNSQPKSTADNAIEVDAKQTVV